MTRFAYRRGIALLSVLLLVAAMAVLAVAVLDDMRFSRARGAAVAATEQARWYGLGAEALARVRIAQLQRRDRNRTTLEGDWHGQPFTFPIEFGLISVRVVDGGNCFNLNALARPPAESDDGEDGPAPTIIRDPVSVAQLRALARDLGVSRADIDRLIDLAIDWIDPDQRPEPLGGEDEIYRRADPPRRTGDALFAEVSELRGLPGLAPETYTLLRPFLCALPTRDRAPININTLGQEQASLLVMLLEGRLRTEAARAALARRPASGFESLVAFWDEPLLAAAGPSPEARAQAQLTTRYFAFDGEVAYREARARFSGLIEARTGDRPRVIARRWTADE